MDTYWKGLHSIGSFHLDKISNFTNKHNAWATSDVHYLMAYWSLLTLTLRYGNNLWLKLRHINCIIIVLINKLSRENNSDHIQSIISSWLQLRATSFLTSTRARQCNPSLDLDIDSAINTVLYGNWHEHVQTWCNHIIKVLFGIR